MYNILYFDLNNKTSKNQLSFYNKEFYNSKFSFMELSENGDYTNLIKELGTKSDIDTKYIYKSIIELIKYKRKIKSGFFLIKNKSVLIIEYNDVFFNQINDLYTSKKTLTPKLPEQIEFFLNKYPSKKAQIINFQKESNEDVYLKFEQVKWLKEIENKLIQIDDDIELLKTLIELHKINDRLTKKINYSKIIITSEYKIILPLFNDIEINMSDLTKAIYLLFYNYPKGIDINHLSLFKNELLGIYLKLSKLSDYDKMINSINKVVDIESKEIYVHLSRIKKAFINKVDTNYISDFIVKSEKHGNPVKSIKALQKN